MLKHNLLIIIRNLRRHKSSFVINLVGLSTGLTCALLIYLWVTDEMNVDKFHQNDKRLYQVMESSIENGNILVNDHTQGPLAEAMARDLPEVELAVPVMSMQKVNIRIPLKAGEKVIKGNGIFAGKSFFKVFTYPLIEGTPDQVLANKESIVLSESFARSLFGSANAAVGKNIDWEIMGQKKQAMISGVFKDLPNGNSMLFDFAFTFDIIYYDIVPNFQKWWNEGPDTYLLVKQGTDIRQLNAKVKTFISKYNPETIFTIFLRQYSSGYLFGHYENGQQAGGRIEYVRLFTIIAVFILLIACINFMNLSTARASRRLKEVGIKKAVGSSRGALVLQFLSEAVFISFLSLIAAVMIVVLILPVFNYITGKHLSISPEPSLILKAILITLTTGLISGSYPAFYMSGFKAISMFKGSIKKSLPELFVRKGLVVFQFVVSLVLIVSVVVIYRQISYVQSKNLGYDRDNIVHFEKEGTINENPQAFMNELKKINGIKKASMMEQSIFQNASGSSTYGINWPGKTEKDLVNFAIRSVDFGLLETLGIQIKQGRSFSNAFGSENTKLIFNETAIKIMGLKNAVGTKVNLWGEDMTIIGVMKDFHVSSLHEKIEPVVFRCNPEGTSTVMAKISRGKEKETIAAIEALFHKFNPGFVFEFRFLDDMYQEQYISEQRISVLSRYFAGLAIIISCLGLFGLAAFNAEVRTKEIGIRKVLGATVSNIMLILSKDFVKLIVIAMLIAFPLAWWAMNEWLDNFAYKTSIGYSVFFVAGAFIIMITILTVGYQSLKTALMNPVRSLRTE